MLDAAHSTFWRPLHFPEHAVLRYLRATRLLCCPQAHRPIQHESNFEDIYCAKFRSVCAKYYPGSADNSMKTNFSVHMSSMLTSLMVPSHDTWGAWRCRCQAS